MNVYMSAIDMWCKILIFFFFTELLECYIRAAFVFKIKKNKHRVCISRVRIFKSISVFRLDGSEVFCHTGFLVGAATSG